MNDDLLRAATRALEEEAAELEVDGRLTRARVMASLHQGKIRRRTRLAFVLPLAACLAVGTAWGAATGRLPAMFHAIGRLVTFASSEPSAPEPTPAPPPRAAAPRVPPSAVPEPAPEPTSAAAVKPAAPNPVVVPSGPAPAVASSAPFRDVDGDNYRVAHEAHFVHHDYARALAGWDTYLRAAPDGRFATEARYNRAICLLRLGRNQEARRALEPFASGLMGYRQSEARQLREELTRAAPSDRRGM